MAQCKRYSNWLDRENDPFFPDPSDGSSWGGIYALQKLSVQANDMHQCLELTKAEHVLLEKETDLNHFFELVNLCESRLLSGHDQTWWILTYARLLLAQNLLALERRHEFSFQLQQIRVTMDNHLPWLQWSDSMKLWFHRLQVNSEAAPDMENLPARLSLALTMRESEDKLQETAVLLDIQVILYEVDQLKRNSAWMEWNAANMDRLNELNSGLGGSALSTSHVLSRFGKTDDSTANAGEFFHRFEQFESKFPVFDIPFHRLFLYEAASAAAQRLGNKELYLSFEARMSAAWANCPVDTALLSFRYRGKDIGEWPRDFFITLLEWIKLDFEKGSLTNCDVARLLLLDQTTITRQEIISEHLTIDLEPDRSRKLTDRMYGEKIPLNPIVWEQHVGRYERWLWDCPREIEQSLRHTILLDMHQVRNTKLLEYQREMLSSVNLANQDLQLDLHRWRIAARSQMAELRKKVDKNAVGASQGGILSDEWHLMNLKIDLSHSVKAVQDSLIGDDDLLAVQTWMEEWLAKFPTQYKAQRLLTLLTIARTMNHRYKLFRAVPPDAALDIYTRYDEAYIEQRRERSILRGSNNLTARAQVVEYQNYQDHYVDAMACCIEALGPGRLQSQTLQIFGQDQRGDPGPTPRPGRSKDSLQREFIDWAQKRKARSVIEVLGAEIVVPQRVLASFEKDEDAVSLLQREAYLQEKLDSKPPNPVEVSKELAQVRKKMGACPSLQLIMNIRDGEAFTSGQIQAISKGLGPRILMVDYVYLPSSSTALKNEILSMVYKNGVLHNSHWITPDLNYASLTSWVRTFIDTERGVEPLSTEEAEEELALLSPLIIPAVEASEPGDTILLCPTGPLFSIPLHAIPVNNQPFIERNPIVYTQSFSFLRICTMSTASLTAESAANPLAVQALPDSESSLHSAPTMAFARRIDSRLLSGGELTKASFLEAITQSSLIHFYGHVSFDESKPLDHHLAIRGIASERITARELFDVRVRSGAHVNLIGCRSGRSEVRANDDQLGLSTALFHAGAGSILSALWAIRKEDAHEFQEAFFDELLVQVQCEDGLRSREGEGGATVEQSTVNLAKVLQKAMLRVSMDEKGERRKPYHWAAFMLQGDWDALPIQSLRKN